jgi:hypothetical protein
MSEKGDAKKEMMDRFASMGIPKPVKPISNSTVTPKNPEMASKMEQIKNGGLKNNFKQFIDKAEKVSHSPSAIPVPKVGKNPNEKAKNVPNLKSYSSSSSSEASMLENMMYGDGNKTISAQSGEISDYGPAGTNTRQLLQQRLAEKKSQVSESGYQTEEMLNYNPNNNITDAELTEKITEIAKKVSRDMIKKVILELSESKGGLVIESKNVKKAEVIARNKVKIDGKVYKLSLDK